ncbi:MAG: hypothetical protein LJE91_11030, partial [Gammaproteobacteria bacterium]|nr:hypothetical protein [Gammaproteobacteria bacterium]
MVRIISPIGKFSRWGSGCGTWRFDRLWPKVASLLAISLLALNAGVARGAAYEQSAGGLVVIEAEHFDASTPRAGHEWLLKTSPGGFEGEGSMLAAPED